VMAKSKQSRPSPFSQANSKELVYEKEICLMHHVKRDWFLVARNILPRRKNLLAKLH